jgi:hypothetical protein
MPTGVAAEVATVKTEVTVPFAGGMTEDGAKPQVTVAFTGVMAQVNDTAELNPPSEVTVIVDVVELPVGVVAETGVDESPKSLTVKIYVVVRFCPPEAPVTVTV